MAHTEYISDRNLYYDNREWLHTLDHIVDSAVDGRGNAIKASKYVNAGKPIPREVFEKFGMRHPQEDKNATADEVEDKSVTTTPKPARRRRVVGSANAPEVLADQAARDAPEAPTVDGDTPDASPETCAATTKAGRTCGLSLPCRYQSHTPGGSAG